MQDSKELGACLNSVYHQPVKEATNASAGDFTSVVLTRTLSGCTCFFCFVMSTAVGSFAKLDSSKYLHVVHLPSA